MGANPIPRTSVVQDTLKGSAAIGAWVGGGALGAAVAGDSAVIVAPSPAMAYTLPAIVPTKTEPWATAMQQSFAPSTSKLQSFPPVATSRA